MKLASVPYGNAIPIIDRLEFPIWQATPRQILENPKEWDIALLSIVSLFENRDWQLIPGVAIGSFYEVKSVKLIPLKKFITIENLKFISLSVESNTGNVLLKILLQFLWKRNLQEITWCEGGNREAEAKLVIGDTALNEENPHEVDLGKAWTDWTGLPFVYAMWIAKNLEGVHWGETNLIPIALGNLKNLEGIAKRRFADQYPPMLNYWKTLCYDWGPKQIEALALFKEYYQKLTQS